MKRDKLFEDCLSKIDPEDREYVRTQMEYKLMGLPTDEELDEWYDYDALAEASARYIRNLAAQKIKEQKARDIEKFKQWFTKWWEMNEYLPLDVCLKSIEKAMEE